MLMPIGLLLSKSMSAVQEHRIEKEEHEDEHSIESGERQRSGESIPNDEHLDHETDEHGEHGDDEEEEEEEEDDGEEYGMDFNEYEGDSDISEGSESGDSDEGLVVPDMGITSAPSMASRVSGESDIFGPEEIESIGDDEESIDDKRGEFVSNARYEESIIDGDMFSFVENDDKRYEIGYEGGDTEVEEGELTEEEYYTETEGSEGTDIGEVDNTDTETEMATRIDTETGTDADETKELDSSFDMSKDIELDSKISNNTEDDTSTKIDTVDIPIIDKEIKKEIKSTKVNEIDIVKLLKSNNKNKLDKLKAIQEELNNVDTGLDEWLKFNMGNSSSVVEEDKIGVHVREALKMLEEGTLHGKNTPLGSSLGTFGDNIGSVAQGLHDIGLKSKSKIGVRGRTLLRKLRKPL